MTKKMTIIGLLFGLLSPLGTALADQAEELQSWMDTLTSSGGVLAVTAMTLDGDSVEHFASGVTDTGGPRPNPNTQFQIGSITKVFTNLLLAEAVEDGVVTYETTIDDVLGDRVSPANSAVGDIRLIELATHSSGLPRLQPNFAPQDPLNPYASIDSQSRYTGVNITRAKQPLGKTYAYSNFGMGLEGHMLGIAYGSSYGEALVNEVLVPLGLSETGFEEKQDRAVGFSAGGVVPAWTFGDATAAAGALWGSTADFERFARILLGDTEYPLDHDPADNLMVVVEDLSGFDVTRVWHVAYADDQPVYWHNGGTGGYASFFGFRPDTHQAVAILVSGNEPPLQKGLRLLGASPKERAPVAIDTTTFGEYQLTPQIMIGVFEKNGQLFAQLTGQGPLALTLIRDGWYAVQNVDASLHFVRDDGKVVAAELAQGGMVQSARRVADVAAVDARKELQLDTDELSKFVGDYAINANAKFTIRLADTGLEAQLTGQPFLPVFASGNDVFFYKVVDAELHFERDGDGDVIALVLKQGSINQKAERVSD